MNMKILKSKLLLTPVKRKKVENVHKENIVQGRHCRALVGTMNKITVNQKRANSIKSSLGWNHGTPLLVVCLFLVTMVHSMHRSDSYKKKDSCTQHNLLNRHLFKEGKPGGRLYMWYYDYQPYVGIWYVFQRRRYGNLNYDRTWMDYNNGFSSQWPSIDQWLGLDSIHAHCGHESDNCELRVDILLEGDSKCYHATYASFYIDDGENNYRLHVKNYTGNAGDELTAMDNMSFSTKDCDNDPDEATNCAQNSRGGWWYNSSCLGNLNGMWMSKEYDKGMNWYTLTGFNNSIIFSQMKMRKPLRSPWRSNNVVNSSARMHVKSGLSTSLVTVILITFCHNFMD